MQVLHDGKWYFNSREDTIPEQYLSLMRLLDASNGEIDGVGSRCDYLLYDPKRYAHEPSPERSFRRYNLVTPDSIHITVDVWYD